MSDTVIKVDNLSKKYILSHQSQERYTALRDVMANGVKRLGKKVFSPFTSHVPQFNNSTEEFYALNDVSFEIKQGDRVGIIGRNGAGKSTLLKILSRITEPTSGRIEITGRVASLLEVGTGFHPELTGRENIFLNGAILGMGRVEIKRKFDEIVDFAEVEKFLDTPVKRYSSGMYVRLAFAVAAHLEPEILIVDEVLAVGDAQFQKKCLGKMEAIGNEGRTVLFVSHNISAIASLCNVGLILSQGGLAYRGQIADVIDTYMNKSVSAENTFLDNISGLMWWLNGIHLSQYENKTTHINTADDVYITIDFEGKESRKLSFELLLKDSNHHPILFIPFGLAQNINLECTAGKYSLRFRLDLPHLALGEYFVDVYIVESFIQRLAVFQNAFSFEVITSYIAETGWTFEQNAGLGCIIGKVGDCKYIKVT